eukprot:60147_1
MHIIHCYPCFDIITFCSFQYPFFFISLFNSPIFLISLFNSPLNLNDAVVPLIAMDMIQLRCSYRGSLRECARITANGSATENENGFEMHCGEWIGYFNDLNKAERSKSW